MIIIHSIFFMLFNYRVVLHTETREKDIKIRTNEKIFLFRLIRPVIPVNSTTHCNMKGKEKKTRPEVDELKFS